MKFTLSWLKDHLETSASGRGDLADKLSSMGLEVESVDDPAKKLGAVHHRARAGGQAAPQCRPPARVPGRHRQAAWSRWCAARPTPGPA